MHIKAKKISIIGVGRVGATIAYTILIKDLANELILVDQKKELAMGEAYDLLQAASFTGSVNIRAGDYRDTEDSAIIIISASVSPESVTSGLEFIKKNALLFKEIIPEIVKKSPGAILIIITKPLDIMTYIALNYSGLPVSRVIGTGTLITTARFKKLMKEEPEFASRKIQPYILGEMGTGEFPAFRASSKNILDKLINLLSGKKTENIFEQIRKGEEMVIRYKGYTNYSIAMAATSLVDCIVNNRNKILTVSTLIDGFLGVTNICLSIPAVIGREGIIRTLELSLDKKEQKIFQESGNTMKNFLEKLKYM